MTKANGAKQADIGLTGLGVMGRNLAFNMAEKGYVVAIHNRSPEKTDEAMAMAGSLAERLVPCRTLADLAAAVRGPRAIVLMVQAGAAVDQTMASLAPHLAPGDCLIDAGNANFRDTVRRFGDLSATHGFDMLGVGVSGGEEGARHGPSIMVGGRKETYDRVGPILTAIAARYEGTPCCAHVGPDGAGHFVKTIHNGIEYADMQMIAEIYGMMRHGLGLSLAATADAFARWNEGPLGSYLIEITATVLRTQDPGTGGALVDMIVDSAGQKGTGRWSAIEAIDLGVPASTIGAAVEARALSSLRALRRSVGERFGGTNAPLAFAASEDALSAFEQTLLAGKICAYAQGFAVMAAASTEHGWDLPLGDVARIWRAGCIIRSRFLDRIAEAFDTDPGLETILLHEPLAKLLSDAAPTARAVLSKAVAAGLPTPALGAAIGYFDTLRQFRTTADLIQAQRDYFGAHGFERIDGPGVHHGPWGS